MDKKHSNEYWMTIALEMAQTAYDLGEVPVGAVIVKDNHLVATGYNLRETNKSSIAHAELIAIEKACQVLNGWRLENCDLYVTLEPCPMCAGGIINSRISRVVFGTQDPKSGCFGSILNFNNSSFNHKPELISGVLSDQCSAILKRFFKDLRNQATLR